MRRINYESDFVIVEPLKDEAPFRYTYYINDKLHVAEYDGIVYTGCHSTGEHLLVAITGGELGVGTIRVRREFFLNNELFADGVCRQVTNDNTDISLWRGESDDVKVDIDVSEYYHVLQVSDGSVTTVKIADGSVTEAKLSEEVRDKLNRASLEDGSVTTDKVADNSITTPKIADGAVEENKLSEAVREKLNAERGVADGSVTTAKLADNSVTESKLDNSLKSKLDILYKVTLGFSGGKNANKQASAVTGTLTWTIKVNGTDVDPIEQRLNGTKLDNAKRSYDYSLTPSGGNKTYTLEVDGVTATQYVRFYNPQYYGVVGADYTPSDNVSGLSMGSTFGTRSLTTSAITTSEQKKYVYMYPASLGNLTSIKDANGFNYTNSFSKSTLSVHGETYNVYLLIDEAKFTNVKFIFT